MPRLLIVEDDPTSATVLKEALFVHGLSVVLVCQTLREALIACVELQPGAVLLDLTLPDASGVQAVSVLTQQFPMVPLIVVTGRTDIAEQAFRAGAQDVLIKGEMKAGGLARVVMYAIERHKVRSHFAPLKEALNAAVDSAARLQSITEKK